MKMLICGLVFCIFNAMLVTGEEVLLLTYKKNIYSYNTINKKTKKIAEKAVTMACDYDRQLIYYSLYQSEKITLIGRVNKYGVDKKIIFDKGDQVTYVTGVDQETGNLYYNSEEGIGFLSYAHNYSKTILSTTLETKDVVYDFGFYGKGGNKRVYWSTWTNLYKLQPGTSKPIALGVRCHHFIILSQGMVCQSVATGLYLANLDGVKTESLSNIAITSSKLRGFDCVDTSQKEEIMTARGIIYILCSEPNRLFKLSVTNNAVRSLILEQQPGLPREEWESVCVWHHEKSVTTPKTVTSYSTSTIFPNINNGTGLSTISTGTPISNSTIFMVVGIITGILLVLAIQTVLIRKCPKNKPKTTIDKNPNEKLDDSGVYDEIEDSPAVQHQYQSVAYVTFQGQRH